MAGLAEMYLDLPPGIAGAAVAAIAKRLGLTGIATLDRRHFTVIRPRHVHVRPAQSQLPGRAVKSRRMVFMRARAVAVTAGNAS
jgi:hypothetical protein